MQFFNRSIQTTGIDKEDVNVAGGGGVLSFIREMGERSLNSVTNVEKTEHSVSFECDGVQITKELRRIPFDHLPHCISTLVSQVGESYTQDRRENDPRRWRDYDNNDQLELLGHGDPKIIEIGGIPYAVPDEKIVRFVIVMFSMFVMPNESGWKCEKCDRKFFFLPKYLHHHGNSFRVPCREIEDTLIHDIITYNVISEPVLMQLELSLIYLPRKVNLLNNLHGPFSYHIKTASYTAFERELIFERKRMKDMIKALEKTHENKWRDLWYHSIWNDMILKLRQRQGNMGGALPLYLLVPWLKYDKDTFDEIVRFKSSDQPPKGGVQGKCL